jgi:Osmosensitive K+ channel histidine kinase
MLLSADIVEIRGEPHVLVNALDITERKQAEQELLRALTREKELSELKSNFVSLVSHEFRTPLGIISTSSEILRDYLTELSETERRERLDSIARNTRRMSDLMEEVLVIGRLDAGKLDFEPALLDLAALCYRLVDEVLSATNRVCPINVTLGSLPADASPMRACCATS